MSRSSRAGAFSRPRFAIVVAVTALLAALVGWPAQVAVAASGKCADLYNITKPTPSRDQLPGFTPAGSTAPSYPLGSYEYGNPGENARGMPAITDPDVLNTYGTSTDGKTPGSADHLYTAWNRYLKDKAKEGKKPLPWNKWLNRYVPNMGNNPRGKAYEQYAAETIGLGGDWLCQEPIPGAPAERTYDAVNHNEKIAYEFKSGRLIDRKQVLKDAEIQRTTGYRIKYVFGTKPRQSAVNFLADNGLNDPFTMEAAPVVSNPGKVTPGPSSEARPAQLTPSSGLSRHAR